MWFGLCWMLFLVRQNNAMSLSQSYFKELFSQINSTSYEQMDQTTNYVQTSVANVGDEIYYQSKRFMRLLSDLKASSIKKKICEPVTCNDCYAAGVSKYVMCDVCCNDVESYKPVSIDNAVHQETGSSLLSETNRIFLKSVEWLGLHPVFTEFRTMRRDQKAAVVSLVNNFNWNHQIPLIRPEAIDILNEKHVCGYFQEEPKVGRVVGGREVLVNGKYPWQVSLATGFFGYFYQHRCGGTLLAKRWVLTAAHCMHEQDVASTYVMAGFLAVNSRDTAQIRNIESAVNHNNFVPDLYEQDISLLKLDSPFFYSNLVLPACLPPPNSDHLNMLAVLTGWGREWDHGTLANQLREVTLPVVSNAVCMDWYAKSGSRQLIPDTTFLCAGYEQGQMDACSGDSGGPLVSFRADRRAEVIGLVSWGIGCGRAGRPGVYTRVSQFYDWIQNVIATHP